MEICRVIHSNARQLEKASRILVSTVKCGDEDMTARWSKWRVVEKGKEIVEPWALLTRPHSNSSIYKVCGPSVCCLYLEYHTFSFEDDKSSLHMRNPPSRLGKPSQLFQPHLFLRPSLYGVLTILSKNKNKNKRKKEKGKRKKEKGKRNQGIKRMDRPP